MRIKKNANFRRVKLLIALTALFITPPCVKAATGEVDVSIQHQIIEGFGASGAWYENWLYPGHPQKETLYDKLFDELGPRYKSRNGGYTRIVKVGLRRGDAVLMSIVELVDRPGAGAVEEEPVQT